MDIGETFAKAIGSILGIYILFVFVMSLSEADPDFFYVGILLLIGFVIVALTGFYKMFK